MSERADFDTALTGARIWADVAASVVDLAPPRFIEAPRCSLWWLAICRDGWTRREVEQFVSVRGVSRGPANVLRTAVLCPPDFEHQRAVAVDHVVSRRRALVAGLPGATPPAKGRLLVYMPDRNLADGAGEFASQGFFDMNNTPPWDTWVALVPGTYPPGDQLLAWVPERLEAIAQAGIEVNPEACIRWVEGERYEDVVRQLAGPSLASVDLDRAT